MKYLTQILIVLFLTSCNVGSNKKESYTIDSATLIAEIPNQDTIKEGQFIDFQNTIIIPHKNLEIQNNKNIIYCSSFEISWNKIRDEILKSPVLLDKHVAWVDYLNKLPKNNSISSDYISAIVGFVKDDILSKIQSELKEKFNFHYNPDYELNETDILSVAYLKKEIKFYKALNEDFGDEKLLFNGTTDVDFFGVSHGTEDPTYKSKLRVHDYINKDDFIFEIETKSNKDEVYFAKISPELTLEETYQKVIERINKNNLEFLGHDEEVRIPYIKFFIKKEFNEVEGAKILNEDFNNYFIGRAIQIINFDLNESGITVESIAETYSSLCYIREPKKLIFDKPFLIIIKEKEKEEPYFLMWINNTELMSIKK